MKKYKLIKDYPYSGYQLNQVIETEIIWINGQKVYLKNYPEFWEEVVEKTYEVLKRSYHECKSVSNGGYYEVIESIKRTSDGAIFSVGDYYEVSIRGFGKRRINSFDVRGDALFINYGDSLLDSLLPPKKPLFTTADGVEIFEGDTYYYICGDFIILKATGNNVEEFLSFSTREKAEEYVLLNKPCLSINDVSNIKSASLKEYPLYKLKEIVRSRI